MFRTIFSALALTALLSCTTVPMPETPEAPQEGQNENPGTEEPTSKTLVVYYSFTGTGRDVADYETIVIVTPLWWSNMAAIMQSYLFKEGSKMKDKKVGLIVSSSSSSISSVVSDAKRLVPDAQWMGEALWINDSNRSKSVDLVKAWWN